MVARETSIAEALANAGAATDRLALDRLSAYTQLLLEKALPLGFIGPHEGDRLVSRHIAESAALVPFLPSGGRVVDVGSGAGLPGLVLACLGWSIDMIETNEKRAAFLEDAVGRLGVDARVHNARAEDIGHTDLRGSADAAVARALAPPPVALELCLPLVRLEGRVLLLTTPDATKGTDLGAVAEQLGGGDQEWRELAVPGADPPRCVMIVKKFRPTPDRFPRRAGVPKRRPLG